MVWSPSLSPEGAFEKFNYSSHGVEVFADFGQFMYQDTNPDVAIPSSDTALLAWQIGVNAHFNKSMSVKIAPTLYTYAGEGSGNGLPGPFIGQGSPSGQNQAGGSFIYNQPGINDLRVFELPTEYNFKIAGLNAKAFGDFAVNLEGNQRAKAATLVGFKKQTDEDKAYQAGLSIGTNPGLVYGATSKRGTWEARGYWQHVEQYALDVNLTDADFFEGRGNLEGAYGAIAYSFTDAIIGTVRYGYAQRINKSLGTGGSNPDLAPLNPVNNYHLVQLDFTWRF
jgi:hypothetical protein